MRKDAATDDCADLDLIDLDTGEKIYWVEMFDSDASEVRRLVMDADGNPMLVGVDLVKVTERRRFRVIHTRTGDEVCRTGAMNTDAFDAIKGIVGR